MASSDLTQLKQSLQQIDDLRGVSMVLEWDQATYMPPGGASARGRQIAAIKSALHEKSTSPDLGQLIAKLSSTSDSDSIDGAIVRKAKRDYDRATKLPAELVEEIANHTAQTYVAWTKARPANDFACMVPALTKMVELSRREAECFAPSDHIGDPLVDESDPGMTVASVQKVFSDLRAQLVPIVEKILAKPEPNVAFLHELYPSAEQVSFSTNVITKLGYDFQRGRQDLTHHPFMIRFSGGDIRITTRIRENDPTECLFSTVHEAGHAMYEQNIAMELDGTPLGQGVSAGVHESQSRLWENQVARSRPFWDYFYDDMQAQFPTQLKGVSVDQFYKAINKVSRSLIRTDADEVTYNLHVMMRFDLEMQLLTGELAPKDLAEAWRTRMKQDLGVAPGDDKDGALQDVHWYAATIGGKFQGYTLGNMMSAQFFEAASNAVPTVMEEIRQGEFSHLRSWLTENVYCHGARYVPQDLVKRATGKPLTAAPLISYLQRKYGELYSIDW